MTTFAHASSKLGTVKPELKKIAKELFSATDADVWFMWGDGPGNEHGSGLALDLMVRNREDGDKLRDYIWRNRERLRLRHVIWEQHITSTVVSPGVRRKMADRGNTTANHYDHVHVWFFPGAYRAPAAPRPTSPTTGVEWPTSWTLNKGDKGPRVAELQQALRAVFPLYAGKLAVDGRFGPATDKAVREFQRRSGLDVDGRFGPASFRAARRSGITLSLPKGYRL